MGARLSVLALSLAPYVAFGGFLHYCLKQKDTIDLLQDRLESTSLIRKAMWVHFLYFVGVPIMIEAFPDAPGVDLLVGSLPPPSNVFHMMSCLAAENFFVTSTALGALLAQPASSGLPRWALLTPYAQIAWNLKNHLSWWFLGSYFCPDGPFVFAVVDMCLIWPITGIYMHHFFTAPVIKEDKKD